MVETRRQLEMVQRAEVARGRALLLRSQLRATRARLGWELERLRGGAERWARRRSARR